MVVPNLRSHEVPVHDGDIGIRIFEAFVRLVVSNSISTDGSSMVVVVL
jgi:hypothetical protein